MLVDSFLFNDEVDLAAARLKYLSPVVDYFVVGEASLDHAGNQKPFHWLENSDVFANLNDKILRVEICEKDLASDVEHVFGIPDRAIGQIIGRSRQIIGDYVKKHLPNCHLVYSDVDEIPNIDSLSSRTNNVVFLEQSLRYYYANFACVTKPYNRLPTSLLVHLPSVENFNLNEMRNLVFEAQARYLGSYHGSDTTFSRLISSEFEERFDCFEKPQIERDLGVDIKKDGGWHYSYLGGVEGVLRKIRCSGHQEIFGNGDIGDSQIIAAIREGHDFFGHGIKFCFEEPLVLNKLTPIDYMPESFKNKNTL